MQEKTDIQTRMEAKRREADWIINERTEMKQTAAIGGKTFYILLAF